MATAAHLAGVPEGREFRVQCSDGSIRHSGSFRDYGRAEHWALQPGIGCCTGLTHHVIPVTTRRAVQP